MDSGDDTLSSATVAEIETFLDGVLVEEDVPGASYALLAADGICHAAGLGARNLARREPATPETLYSVASVTKTVTALATLQLVDRGDLALDDEIREYVDVWSDVPGDPITVHDLLSHSSGMPTDYAGQREFLFSRDTPTSPIVTRADDVRHANGAADTRIEDPEEYLYSNRGYGILGEIVGTVAGRSHAEFVEDEIFAPLGMERSQVGYGQLSAAAEDVMTGYVVQDGDPVEVDHDLEADMRPPYAAGGVLSSVRELAALVRCLLNRGEYEGTRLLSVDLVEQMSSHQAPAGETVDGQAKGYGYGLRVEECMGETVVGHTGTSPVSRAYAGFLPDQGVGVTLGSNTSALPIDQVAYGVLAILTGRRPTDVVPYFSLRAKLDAVTGTYEGYRGGVTVTVETADTGSYLDVTYEDGPGWEFPAFPESLARDDYAFYTVRDDGTRDPVRFHETDAGMELYVDIDRLVRTGDR